MKLFCSIGLTIDVCKVGVERLLTHRQSDVTYILRRAEMSDVGISNRAAIVILLRRTNSSALILFNNVETKIFHLRIYL